ncbi:Rec8 like protein-domain-containing protein [Entophlyctis helioformis]|nr:Rec8 like protein-domain-containing protein [Entophlyctis helioformis]
MFYSETILSKKGPLAKVWLAAHWERKLSKSQFLQTNIQSSVSAILTAGAEPMALRLSGQLLLGVVRIFSRKTRYLLEDCNEALMKIKLAWSTWPRSRQSQPALLNIAPANTALTISRLQDITLAETTFFSASQREDLLAEPMADVSAAGFDQDEPMLDLQFGDPPSLLEVEVGRDAPAPLPFSPGGQDAEIGLAAEKTRDGADPLNVPLGQDFSIMAPSTVDAGGDLSLAMPDAGLAQGDEYQDPLAYAADDNYDFGFGEPLDLGIPNDDLQQQQQQDNERDPALDANNADDDVVFKVPQRPALKRAGDAEEVPRKRAATQQRKRKLVVDDEIDVADQIFRQQLQDTSDICQPELMGMNSRSYTSRAGVDDFPDALQGLFSGTDDLHRFEFAYNHMDGYDNYDPFLGGDDYAPVPEALDLVVPGDGDDLAAIQGHADGPTTPKKGEAGGEANGDAENQGLGKPQTLLDNQSFGNDVSLAETDMASFAEVSVDLGVARAGHDTSALGRPQPSLYEFDDPETAPVEGEAGISRHTSQTIKLLQDKFENQLDAPQAHYSDFVRGAPKSARARFFFELLVLKTKNMIDVEQPEPCGDIAIVPQLGLFATATA